MSTRSAVASAQLARLTVAGHRATCSPSPALPRTGSPFRWSASQRHTFQSVCVRPLQPSPWGRVGTDLPRGQERVPPSEPLPKTGRYSRDYYENSVTVGLSTCRRSHVPLRRNVLTRRRCPTHALQCARYASSIGQGVVWKKLDSIHTDGVGCTDVLPTSVRFHHWTLGFGQSSSHPIA